MEEEKLQHTETKKLLEMAAETFVQLKARKALPWKANAAEVRYAADYIVKKSPFAKFFKALGITKGSQIRRTFNDYRRYHYLTAIAQLYYVLYYDEDLEDLSNFDVIFAPGARWEGWIDKIFWHFKRLQQWLKAEVYRSMDREYESMRATNHGCVDRKLQELRQHPSENFMSHIHEVLDSPALVTIVALEKGLHNQPDVAAYIKKHSESMISTFVRNGYIRSKLRNCHGVCFYPGTNIFTICRADFRIKENMGISHADLNAMALDYQEYHLNRLRQMENAELFEDYDHYYGTPLNAEEGEEQEEDIQEVKEDKEEPLEETELMTDDIYTSGSLTEASLDEQIVFLAHRLAKKHGPVTITSEASGIHIYIPDPELVIKDGRKELASKHLAINAEKYLGIGRYDVHQYPTKENKVLYGKYYSQGLFPACAVSMKTKKVWSVSELLNMLPLEKRIPDLANVPATVTKADPNKHLVYDAKGNLVPRWVGETVPLTDLPEEHPAIQYLVRRGYDPTFLSAIYDVCYCTKAEPENRATYVYYARLPAGRKNSTACRIIFPIYDENWVCHGWQARCIDMEDIHGDKWLWTDQGDWLQITKGGDDLYVSEEFPKGFKAIQKYKNAQGSSRNTLLFGLKQAIDFNKGRPPGKKFCVLVEGPLDVCKGGPPCIALLGKSMSPEQAAKIRAHFDVVGIVADKDEAGKQCLARVRQQMTEAYHIKELQVPEGCKDLGDCSKEQAQRLVYSCDPLHPTQYAPY